MDELLKQNENLQQMAAKYYKQMTELQQLNVQHEFQIDTLLKFNEKLLGIIEKQLNGQKLKNSDILSLQPISEKTEIQSEMFQSQLPSAGGNLANQAQRLLQKKSLNLRPDPLHERINRLEPMAIIQRQEQLSIDLEGQKQVQQQDQIQSLIQQYRKDVRVGGATYSITQISQMMKAQTQQLAKIKKQFHSSSQTKLQKLNDIRNDITSINPKQGLISMLNQFNCTIQTKHTLATYIKSID